MPHTNDQLSRALTHLGHIAQWYFAEHPNARMAAFQAELLEQCSEAAGVLADLARKEEELETSKAAVS